jgi:hypothetical protein
MTLELALRLDDNDGAFLEGFGRLTRCDVRSRLAAWESAEPEQRAARYSL